MLDGQAERPPDRNPSCVAAEESGRRLARAVLESIDAIKLDAVVYPLEQPAALIGALNSPHDKSADEKQSLVTKPISPGTERRYGAGGEGVATSSLHLTDGVPRCPSRTTPAFARAGSEQVPRRPGPK